MTSGDKEPENSPVFWRTQEMLLLQQVTALAGRDFSPDTVLREMLPLLSELLGLNRGRIVLLDESGQSSQLRHAYGLTADEISRCSYTHAEGGTGRRLES